MVQFARRYQQPEWLTEGAQLSSYQRKPFVVVNIGSGGHCRQRSQPVIFQSEV